MALLIVLGGSLTTQEVSFRYGNSGMQEYNRYSLGEVANGAKLYIRIAFPNPTHLNDDPDDFDVNILE